VNILNVPYAKYWQYELTATGSAEPFGGFGFAIRTFWITAENLVVARGCGRRSSDERLTDDDFSTSIFARAVSQKDTVRVIGTDRVAKEFDLHIFSDVNAKERWNRTRSVLDVLVRNDGSTPELRIHARINELLDQTPPTATMLVFDADWEIGLKAGWSIECLCPTAVLAQLELDLLAQRVWAIEIGIEWTAGLVRDEHAPPSVPTVWGLYTISGKPEPLRGHVTSIGWRVVPGLSVHSKGPPVGQTEPQKSQRNANDRIEELRVLLRASFVSFSRRVAFGFIVTFGLILIAHFFR
jgi:hypothetical protein